MSEKILKALMQLFAIIANREQLSDEARSIVVTFLRRQVSQSQQEYYLNFFDEYIRFLQGKASSGKASKRIAVNSVKILRICTDINSELDQKQKYIVLVKLIEFAWSFGETPGEQELEFIDTVASVFNIEPSASALCASFASAKNTGELENSSQVLVVNNSGKPPKPSNHHLYKRYVIG